MKIPSIVNQTKWKVSFFDFGKAEEPGVRYFNPALISKDGSDWLIARKAASVPGHNIGHNTLVAFKLDESHKPIGYVPIDLTNRAYINQNFEDPRIALIGDQTVLSYCTFQILGQSYSGAHQQVAFLNDGWQPMRTWDPIYGNNGGSILTNSGQEKNWIFFDYEGQMHMVYMTEPHEVVRWDGQAVGDVYKTDGIKWKYGHIRGGSNAIRVGDEYISFFHSSVKVEPDTRRYYMGAYCFNAKPPFNATRMTDEPILIGSEEDGRFKGLPYVVFPCGAILSRNNFVVSLGVNDYKSAWIEIPVNELDSIMK